ncbi:MAG: FHA domain-containing protein [Deltaproteobacteria bacterium]|nr:FHA domain-containing protein [Deltaproteobacteria bacterium]
MPIRLLVKSKAETGNRPPEEVVLDAEEVTLGRDKACEVLLNDPVVSRRHVQIVREGALYFAEDKASSGGTRINGASLPANEKRLLKNGDVLAIGPYDVTFDRIADVASDKDEKTSYVAKRVVKDALRGLATGGAPYLRVMNGPLEGTRYEIGDAQELVIGRDEGVEVRLEVDDLVSRRHAKVRRDWSGTTVEDLGSRNGIRLNRKKVTTAQLKDRDEVEVGNTRFLYLDPSEVREVPVVPEERPAKSKSAQPAESSAPPKEEKAKEQRARVEKAPAPAPEPEPEPPPEPEPAPEAEPEAPQDAQAEEEVGQKLEEAVDFSPTGPLPEPPAANLKERFTSPDGLRSLLPLLAVIGVAVFAVVILLVTLFAM